MAAPLGPAKFRMLQFHSNRVCYCCVKRRWFRKISAIYQSKKTHNSNKHNDIDFAFQELTVQSRRAAPKLQQQQKGSTGENDANIDLNANRKNRTFAPSFKQILYDRYSEASRSVVIKSDNAQNTVHTLTSFGRLKNALFTSQDKAYLLAEFASDNGIVKIMANTSFFSEPHQFPMKSRVLFDPTNQHKKKHTLIPEVEESNWRAKSSNVYPVMNTLDEELEALCEHKSLDDGALRLRFFACLLVEDLVRSVLPNASVIPYGSCLNGFGWWNSDLDMMLCFNKDPYTMPVVKSPHIGNGSSLRHLTEIFNNNRRLAQCTLSMVASLLDLAPRVSNVFKILNARVPIIRFKNTALNLSCDVSLQAMDSIKMTELLYLYSVSDPRVKPLMFGIKQWAISHHLTSSGEQQKPTTIGILTLLIFYLQTRSPPVLPTLQQIQKLATTSEMFYIDDVLYGLPTSPSHLPKSQNTESIESLLHGFFTFYSSFDFANQAISIIEGKTYMKPAESSPIHMENPLCIGLNICRNVSKPYLDKFTSAMKEAALKLEALASERQTEEGKLFTLCSDKPPQSRLSVLFSNAENLSSQVNVQVADLFAVEEQGNGTLDDSIAENNELADALIEESDDEPPKRGSHATTSDFSNAKFSHSTDDVLHGSITHDEKIINSTEALRDSIQSTDNLKMDSLKHLEKR